MSIYLEQEEIDLIKSMFPDLITEEKKTGMFIRCTLKEGTTTTEIFSLGRLVAIKQIKYKIK